MSYPSISLVFCLMVVCISYSQGLQFFLETTPDGSYCRHLQCWADKFFIDTNILAIVSLSVYDITQPNTRFELASLSVFDPDLYFDKTQINRAQTTGNISDYHAELTLGLRDDMECLTRSYLCELNIVNNSSQHQSIQETVSQGTNGKYLSPATVFNQYAKVALQIKETEVLQLNQRNKALEMELSKLQVLVTNVPALFSVHMVNAPLAELTWSVLSLSHATCYREKPYKNPREELILWDEVPALCDTVTDGGGWIVIQRRTKGDIDFYRNWDDYKTGFGTLDTDFWLGNDNIHILTLLGYTELRIDMELKGRQYFAHYSDFSLANETMNYRLSVSGYDGSSKDSFTDHNGMEFSTFDRDHDLVFSDNCAKQSHGAWWYHECYASNLNGKWGGDWWEGIYWVGLSDDAALTYTEMKVRRVVAEVMWAHTFP